MSKQVKKIPKKQLVSIKKFLSKYIDGPIYTGELKLTHGVLFQHLRENSIKIPKKTTFSAVKEEDILLNKVVYVRDKMGKIIPYINPLYKDTYDLFESLEKKTMEELASIRQKILKQIERAEKIEEIDRINQLNKNGLMVDDIGTLISIDTSYYEFLEESFVMEKKGKVHTIYIQKSKQTYQRRRK